MWKDEVIKIIKLNPINYLECDSTLIFFICIILLPVKNYKPRNL